MRNKIIEFSIVIFIISIILYFTINFGKKLKQDENLINNQKIEIEEKKQEIEMQNEIIETKNNQQRIIIKTSNISDIDNRNKWLQLVFEERKNNN